MNFPLFKPGCFPATLAFMILLWSLALKLAISHWVAVVTAFADSGDKPSLPKDIVMILRKIRRKTIGSAIRIGGITLRHNLC